jgi:cytochrome d ubiquinol oxidase subunit I
MDPLILARLQFAANISFHILFPSITIALGWVLFYFKLRHHRSGDSRWMLAYGFWVKVFALSFALGVVSGITMSFQFGTNWPGYMLKVGNVAGPLLGYEVLTAFFLEATFLGIMLFGRRRVSERMHTTATFLVAFGTTLSAFWILALNSWMQTPAGYEIVDGVVHARDWWAIVFNPSFVGDQHGLNTLEHQPAKIAAMEGVWQTEKGAPALLFGWPNAVTRSSDYAIGIPGLAALILTHDLDGEIRGLDDFDDHPPVAPVFWGFRVMVGVGLLMLVVAWSVTWTLWRRREPGTWQARALVAMTFSGWVATLAGWYVTEIGRQPWLVTGILRTAEAVSATPAPAPMIAASLAGYLSLYAALIVAYVAVLFHMARKAAHGKPAQAADPVEHKVGV